MEAQIKELNEQIAIAYKHMNKTPYYLHAIIVHDGNAQSGHYFAFIFDWFQKKWRKYNDIRITEVSEEEVFTNSNGVFGHSTGYWVVYVDESIQKELSSFNINSYCYDKNNPV
mmetsp:Transcript_21701/g.20808  ORF Transcript_21701/g.20808 Transcript_21701/m.20808 type:complete len:113 (+) Transcript_21701:1482-1820(+)|eukprot:CAMPEP_0170544286 /NCGR_PEP_ID=MMETSP0211-20121228/3108_1 /TAXON_ID=311385 /ORGANISM="Pseudokeronopsis sp., Strain OXSARD2" /LENGTH=112 /DNA_ID=CAMNT_0010847905 /DNA_START=1180 /DNA_END=1518 /DNA_ORIENTATION=-